MVCWELRHGLRNGFSPHHVKTGRCWFSKMVEPVAFLCYLGDLYFSVHECEQSRLKLLVLTNLL